MNLGEFNEIMNKVRTSRRDVEIPKYIYEHWQLQNLRLSRAKSGDKYIILEESMVIWNWDKECYMYYHFEKTKETYYGGFHCREQS